MIFTHTQVHTTNTHKDIQTDTFRRSDAKKVNSITQMLRESLQDCLWVFAIDLRVNKLGAMCTQSTDTYTYIKYSIIDKHI